MLLALFIAIVFLAPIGFPQLVAAGRVAAGVELVTGLIGQGPKRRAIFGPKEGRNAVKDVPPFIENSDDQPEDPVENLAVKEEGPPEKGKGAPDIVFEEFDLKNDFVVVTGSIEEPITIKHQVTYAHGCVLILSNDLIVDIKGIPQLPADRIKTVGL